MNGHSRRASFVWRMKMVFHFRKIELISSFTAKTDSSSEDESKSKVNVCDLTIIMYLVVMTNDDNTIDIDHLIVH